MTKKILFLYSTVDGQTFAIISKIAAYLVQHMTAVEYEVYDLKTLPDLNYESYAAIILGTSVRYGGLHKNFIKFIKANHAVLNNHKTAFFCVSATARKPNRNTPETNTYTHKFLQSTLWQPHLKAVFAGAIRYPKYVWYDKWMIRLIMHLGGEKHDMTKEYVYTDWVKVDEFSNQIIALLQNNTKQLA